MKQGNLGESLPPGAEVQWKGVGTVAPMPVSVLALPEGPLRLAAAEAWNLTASLVALIDVRHVLLSSLALKTVPDEALEGRAAGLVPACARLRCLLMAWAALHTKEGPLPDVAFHPAVFLDIWVGIEGGIQGRAGDLVNAGLLPGDCLRPRHPPRRTPKGHRPRHEPGFDLTKTPPVFTLPPPAYLAYRRVREEAATLMVALRRAPLTALRVRGITLGAKGATEAGPPRRPKVTLSLGPDGFAVTLAGGRTHSLDSDFKAVLAQFALRIAAGVADGPLSWDALNRACEMSNGIHPLCDKDKASGATRAMFSKLRAALTVALGECPDRGGWLSSKRGKGAWLTTAVDWDLSRELKAALKPKARNVYSHSIDSTILEEMVVDRDQKLPTRRRLKPVRDD
jgi:hypothetical protein